VPRFDRDRFRLAPGYWVYYPNIPRWTDPWNDDPDYYDRYYSVWQEPLPTNEMLELALPEGVLEPRGRVNGFLYFQKLAPRASGASFRVDLVDAKTGRSFGSVRVPFVAH
jgi:hypothetical protein